MFQVKNILNFLFVSQLSYEEMVGKAGRRLHCVRGQMSCVGLLSVSGCSVLSSEGLGDTAEETVTIIKFHIG